VVEASSYFSAENHDALDDPRTRLILGDGRSHLLLSTEQYDVIISEPSNPWMAGVASLFTREFFLAARARLAPQGLLMQWAHTYSISDADLRSIVATFVSVFPEGSAWLVGDSDLLLLGATAPIEALHNGISTSWVRPGVAMDLAEVGVRDAFSILSLYVGGREELQRYASAALVQSDDRLLLEYSAPRALYQAFQRANVEQLTALARSARQPPGVSSVHGQATPEQWRNRGLMQLKADATAAAYADLREAVTRAPGDGEALHGLVRAAIRQNRLEDIERVFTEIGYGGTSTASKSVAPSVTVPALVELSIVRAALGRVDDATTAARDAVLRDPASPAALKQLASMYADVGDEDALQRLIQLVEQTAATRSVLLYCQTRLAYVRGEYDVAARLGDELAALEPTDVNIRNLLGSAYAALGDNDRARRALESSLQIEPTNPGVLVNLGTVALRAGDVPAAVERFSEALFLSPTHPAALSGLADALERQGHQERAAEIRAHVPAR
jgi:Flp pilus assembly protein TadD